MIKLLNFVFGQYNIRFTGKVFYMEAVTKTVFMKESSDQHFRLGILAPDTGHVIGAGFFRMNIHLSTNEIKRVIVFTWQRCFDSAQHDSYS